MRTCCSRRLDDDPRRSGDDPRRSGDDPRRSGDDPHRSGDEHHVRAVRPGDEDDYDEHRARRGRRQDAVRRAIERELQGEGLRHRGVDSGASGVPRGPSEDPRVNSHVHIHVDPSPPQRQVDFEPPIPAFAVSGNLRAPSEFGFGGAQSSSSTPAPVDLSIAQTSKPRADPSSSGSSQVKRVMSDASTQTVERSLTIQELCELQLVTTTGRGPGALHLFPNCHALRNVTSTHQRMFCRYCLQAAREGTGGGLPP